MATQIIISPNNHSQAQNPLPASGFNRTIYYADSSRCTKRLLEFCCNWLKTKTFRIRISTLSKKIGSSSRHVRRILAQLEKDGLLIRRRFKQYDINQVKLLPKFFNGNFAHSLWWDSLSIGQKTLYRLHGPEALNSRNVRHNINNNLLESFTIKQVTYKEETCAQQTKKTEKDACLELQVTEKSNTNNNSISNEVACPERLLSSLQQKNGELQDAIAFKEKFIQTSKELILNEEMKSILFRSRPIAYRFALNLKLTLNDAIRILAHHDDVLVHIYNQPNLRPVFLTGETPSHYRNVIHYLFAPLNKSAEQNKKYLFNSNLFGKLCGIFGWRSEKKPMNQEEGKMIEAYSTIVQATEKKRKEAVANTHKPYKIQSEEEKLKDAVNTPLIVDSFKNKGIFPSDWENLLVNILEKKRNSVLTRSNVSASINNVVNEGENHGTAYEGVLHRNASNSLAKS